MATFIKLPKGVLLNANNIGEVHKTSKAYYPQAEKLKDADFRTKHWHPAIKVVTVEGHEYEYAYEDEVARNAEYERIQALLTNDEYLQLDQATSVKVSEIVACRFVSEAGYQTKRLEVKIKGLKPIRVSVPEADVAKFIEFMAKGLNSKHVGDLV